MTEINSVVQLFKMLKDWHTVSVHNAENILKIPTDGSIKVKIVSKVDGSTLELVIDETNKDAFLAGVQSVLCLFEDLPFEFDEPTNDTND